MQKIDDFIVELKAVLKNAKISFANDSLHEKCALLCQKYSMTVSDCLGNIEVFLMNTRATAISIENIGKLEQFMLDTFQNKKRKIESQSQNFSATDSPLFTASSKRLSYQPSPETTQPLSSQLLNNSAALNPNDDSFKKRADKGKVVLTLKENESLDDRGDFEPSTSKPLGIRCVITEYDEAMENVKTRYRSMFTSLDERARALDKHLLKIQKDMCIAASVLEEDLQPVGIPSQDTVWVCGRICCEAVEGRINSSSVILEGSRKQSGGRRVKLDLKDIGTFALFPGQIVLIEGVCSNGQVLVAKRIVEGTANPIIKSSPKQLLVYHHTKAYQNGQALDIIVANGPFTLASNLSYEPLEELIRKILRKKPDVVILNGPFVDISNSLLESGDVIIPTFDEDGNIIGEHIASYEQLFVEKISRDILLTYFNSEEDEVLPTQFVLVPSLQDAHHEFVFPQPPFGSRDKIKSNLFNEDIGDLNIKYSSFDSLQRVHLMPNPCMFRVNEILIGVCSMDVLFALSSDETSQNLGPNRIPRIAAHLLQQQSFCPQFPVPASLVSQLDFRQSKHWQFNLTPDILILPSKLTTMVRDINGTMLLNSGTLAKGQQGGTYAELTIHPLKETAIRDALLEGKETMAHNVTARTKVSVVKI